MTETIAIIGTGNVGGALAVRLGRAGHPVRLGVREGKGDKDLAGLLDRAGPNVKVDTPAAAAAAADVIMLAVQRRLPRNTLARHQLTNLKVYAGAEHPHAAQQPEPLDIGAMNPKNKRSA